MSSQSGRALLTLVRARLLPDIIPMGAFTATPLSQSPRPRGEAPRERRTPVVLLRFAVLLFRSAGGNLRLRFSSSGLLKNDQKVSQ